MMKTTSTAAHVAGLRTAATILLAAISLLLTFAFALPPVSAYASDSTPTVVYNASTGEFSFRHAPDGDLFGNFKSVMPGDESEQAIVVEVINSREIVTVYAAARYLDAEVEGIESIGLSATFEGSEEHAGTFGDLHDMGDPVKLATFRGNGTAAGSIKLTVPTSLGNDTAGTAHALTWEFTAQHEGMLPSDGSGSESGLAQTGDNASTYASLAMAAAIFSCLILISIRAHRRNTNR